jgi:glycosyltransferase involved in cell wall biosynthesis
MKSASTYSKAGLSRYASGLIEGLKEIKPPHEFTFYVNQAFEVPPEWASAPGFRFERTKGKLGRMPHIWGPYVASAISRKYDVWLSLAHTVPFWTPTPRVLVVHDLFSLTNPELYVERRAKITANSLRRSIARAERLISVSHATKRELHERLNVPLDRIDVTHLGPGNLVPARDPSTVSREELQRIGVPFDRYLLMLSTIEPRKNVPRLLQAFAKLAPQHPDLGLAIAGGKGWEKSEIFAMPTQLGIQDRVKFVGYVDDKDLPALFARCEAFVLPSLTEGFGITVLEAMLWGAPVVCSNTGALPEVGGDAALYFDPLNVEDMVQKINARLASDRAAAVAAGREQAQNFSWTKTARETIAVLELSS